MGRILNRFVESGLAFGTVVFLAFGLRGVYNVRQIGNQIETRTEYKRAQNPSEELTARYVLTKPNEISDERLEHLSSSEASQGLMCCQTAMIASVGSFSLYVRRKREGSYIF